MNFPLGTDLVIYRQQGGLWFAKDHTDRVLFRNLQWGGVAFDRPLIGNVGGDARDDLVIYRPAGGFWYGKDVTDAVLFRDQQWGGEAGDIPLLGDVDNDGYKDVLITVRTMDTGLPKTHEPVLCSYVIVTGMVCP